MLTAVPRITVLFCLLAAFAFAQAPEPKEKSLRFDVASLKPSQPGGRGGIIRPAPGGQSYNATNVTVKLLITVAYHVKADQVVGGPDWIDTDRFDMNAKAERPSSIEELHIMLQNLLADRFKLQFHRATKELPIYVLSVDKAGHKLTPHESENAGQPWIDISQTQPLHMNWNAKLVTMDYVAWRLGQVLDRPVLDQTNLRGGFDFQLSYTAELPPNIPADAMINGQPIDISGPRIFEAMRKQLGLTLEPRKGPIEILAVDRLEKPVEN